MSDRTISPRNKKRLEKRKLVARMTPKVRSATAGISAESIALYRTPYEPWERNLVRHLDRQPRSPVLYAVDNSPGLRSGECHHNAERYCNVDCRATHVLGWLDDGNGYILHSVVQVEGQLLEITPLRLSLTLPWLMFSFVRDPALSLTWQKRGNGNTRAVITREGREMPSSLRTPKAAREFRAWANLPQHGD